MIEVGYIKIKADGKLLYMPVPEKAGISLEWADMAIVDRLYDGTYSRRYQNEDKKYVPKLVLKYKYYNDLAGNSPYSIGTTANHMPKLEDLLTEISNASLVEVSPDGVSFFQCFLSKSISLKPGVFIYQDVDLEFQGINPYPSMSLEV
jgi:hypothetical protein